MTRPDRPRLRGDVLTRTDPGYEQARVQALWNGLTPERHPELIVRPATADDVPAALAHARTHGLRVSVRAGGHNRSGTALQDGALLLDLSRLDECTVDPVTSTATVGPGLTGGALAAELARHGLVFPVGHCSTVGLGGYLLAGGFGWNSRAEGPACRHVEELDVVTADGRALTCNGTDHPDLFWAARGAGPCFPAVAVRFRLRLPPPPGALLTTSLTLPLSAASDAGARLLRTARRSPPYVETSLFVTPVGIRTLICAFASDHDRAEAALAPFADPALTDAALDVDPPRPAALTELYARTDPSPPRAHRCLADNMWTPAPYETQLAHAAHLIADSPSPESSLLIPVDPVTPDPHGERLRTMAFPAPGDSYVAVFAVWDDPAEDGPNIRWLRDTVAALDPHAAGTHYIGEADTAPGPVPARRCYGTAAWERLVEIRTRWDPARLLHAPDML